MKSMILVALALVAVAAAAPAEEPVKIVNQEFDQRPDGSYAYTYESADGSKREEQGEVKEVPDEENNLQKVVVVRGSYSYIDADGKPVLVNYFADQNGYNAEGDSIPKAVRR